MNIPTSLKYSKTDEWVKVDGLLATIGITDYVQSQLSDVVFVEITLNKGDKAKKQASCATIESVKAAAEVNLPVSGTVQDTNNGIANTPELVNSDPYGKAWLLKINLASLTELDGLMDAAAYQAYCQEREH